MTQPTPQEVQVRGVWRADGRFFQVLIGPIVGVMDPDLVVGPPVMATLPAPPVKVDDLASLFIKAPMQNFQPEPE